jgi:hypothetical protein
MDKRFEQINWNDVSIRLREKYPVLTDADLDWRDTSHDDLLRTISNELGITMKEIKLAIEVI